MVVLFQLFQPPFFLVARFANSLTFFSFYLRYYFFLFPFFFVIVSFLTRFAISTNWKIPSIIPEVIPFNKLLLFTREQHNRLYANMSDKTFFDEMKRSFKDIPVDEHNQISTREFLEASSSLVKLFGMYLHHGTRSCKLLFY